MIDKIENLKPLETIIRVLLIGPLPPPIGGTSVSFQHLVTELGRRDDCVVQVFRTDCSGGVVWKVWSAIKDFLRLPRLIDSVDVVSFHGSTDRFLSYAFCLHYFCCWLKKPLILRLFGGGIAGVLNRRRFFEMFVLRRVVEADLILLQSKDLCSRFRSSFPGADIRWFPTSRPTISGLEPRTSLKNPARFLFLGHLNRAKGVEVILDAMDLLKDLSFAVTFVGGRVDKELVKRIGSKQGCSFRGEVSPGEVEAIFREADVLLLPTQYDGEGYPGVVIEAFHSGIPVIASRWKYIPEVVADGKNGLLVSPGDVGSLAAAIRALVEGGDLYAVLADGARRSAKFFSSERWNGDEFIRVCREKNEVVPKNWTGG